LKKHMRIYRVPFAAACCAFACACIFGACASDPLPAFAEDGSADVEYDEVDDDGSIGAGTDLGLYGSVSQLRVSVPTRIALAVNIPDQTLTGPAPRTAEGVSVDEGTAQDGTAVRLGTGYGIENYSSFDLVVTSIAGSCAGNPFSFDSWDWGPDSRPVIHDTTTPGNITDLFIRIENHEHPAVDGGWDVLLREGDSAVQPQGLRDFTIAGATMADGRLKPGILGLNVHGSCTPVIDQMATEATTATDAFTITYTLKPA